MAHVAMGWETGTKFDLIQEVQAAVDPCEASSGTAEKPGCDSPVDSDLFCVSVISDTEICQWFWQTQTCVTQKGAAHLSGLVWNARRVNLAA